MNNAAPAAVGTNNNSFRIEDITHVVLNGRCVSINLNPVNGGWEATFPFCRELSNELKETCEAKWRGFLPVNPRKVWYIADTPRARFRLLFLAAKNPYASWREELPEWQTTRPLREHQKRMASQIYHRHYSIIAGEMGSGKTLAALEAAERSGASEIWYVGPKTGVSAVNREMRKWGFNLPVLPMTYNRMVAFCKVWVPGQKPPQFLILDESSFLKTPKTQRSQAAEHLATAIHEEYGNNGWVCELSGTPAPKSPLDWWMQAEIAQPGYLREGNIHLFKKRMGLFQDAENLSGQTFPKLITWFDRDDICATCGKREDSNEHKMVRLCPVTLVSLPNPAYHVFTPAKNEVAFLYKRLGGLVQVTFKKDCMDLPEKQYQIIRVKPSVQTLQAARLIKANTPRAATALILLRELSDGFQYTDELNGDQECMNCHGTKVETVREPKYEISDEGLLMRPSGPVPSAEWVETDYDERVEECWMCKGTGIVPRYKQGQINVDCPKDEVMIDLLEDHEQYGRLVVWAGFTGTIERLCSICAQQGWDVIRYDKKNLVYSNTPSTVEEFLDAMDRSNPRYDELMSKFPKIVFIGNPKAGGMALTLTSSPSAVYFSNDFSGEARIQSEDRIHRLGMDDNRGCNIIDIIHLPTDELVLENLKKKRKLQAVTMGEVDSALKTVSDEYYN